MSAARRRRGGAGEAESENHERWMASYMDMVTVMMCLFIVLFAISQVDQAKFQELRHSLATSFGEGSAEDLRSVDGGSGVLAADAVAPRPPAMGEDSGEPVLGADGAGVLPAAAGAGAVQAAREETARLTEVRDEIAADLEDEGLAEEVMFTITDRGLIVGLVTHNVFFSPSSASMTGTSEAVIDTMAKTLVSIDNDLALEGHANVLPGTEPYPTNWELSADRATKVLRRLVEHGGVPAGRAHAVGYGDAHPMKTDGPDALDLNRRVDVVVLSGAPEHVRELIPEVAAAMEVD